MNKKVILSLLLVPFLTGCANSRSIKTPVEIDKYVSKFKSHDDVTSIMVNSTSHFFDLKVNYSGAYPGRLTNFGTQIEDYDRDRDGNIIYEDDDRTTPRLRMPTTNERGYGNSYHLYAPLFLDYSNLVYFNKYDRLDESCQLSRIRSLLVDSGGSNAVFETEFLKDGGIRFFATSSNQLLDLYHVDTNNEGVSAACRWNISLTYNKKGCLTEEIIETISQTPKTNSAFLKSTYIYA